MPKRAKELTARAVAALKKDGRHAVGGVVGLCLKIEGGSRSWILRIKDGEKRPELGLGSYPTVSLAVAREKAWERRRRKFNVVELFAVRPDSEPAAVLPVAAPPASKPEATPVKTFEFCARTYVDAQAPGWKSGKHAKQWLSTLERYAFPVVGQLDVSEVGIDHILKILSPIWGPKTETATRLRGRIESILDWAAHRGYRSGKTQRHGTAI